VTEGRTSGSPSETKAKRRAAILRAAVELFAQRGYNETTVTQIAESAGMSRRLFFYYFGSKDDILFEVSDAALTLLEEIVGRQPRELSDLDAAAESWKAFNRSDLGDADLSERRRVVVQLRKAAESSPLLRGKEYELHLAYQRAVAAGLARRRGLAQPDAAALTAAAIAQTMMHAVTDRWVLDEDLDRDQLIDEQFALAKTLLGPGRGLNGSKK
jgi:AcrR family transcriptional regulator